MLISCFCQPHSCSLEIHRLIHPIRAFSHTNTIFANRSRNLAVSGQLSSLLRPQSLEEGAYLLLIGGSESFNFVLQLPNFNF
jgi:hypothetical protein